MKTQPQQAATMAAIASPRETGPLIALFAVLYALAVMLAA